MENNTFEDAWRGSGGDGDGGRGSFIEGEEVMVVVVEIRDGRVSDWKGGVREFSMGEGGARLSGGSGELVNGVR